MNRDDNKNKKLVFVSYAHADEAEKDALLPHLKGLELQELIQLWHDRLIGVGEDWYSEIERALTAARVAIVLVSANFLASRFCQEEEFPYLMQRQRRGEIVVLPLLIDGSVPHIRYIS